MRPIRGGYLRMELRRSGHPGRGLHGGMLLDTIRGPDDSRPELYQSLVEQWYIVDDGGQPVRQSVQPLQRSGEFNQNAKSTTYVVPKGYIDTQQLVTENAPLRPGTLVFRTSSAYFDVMKANDVAGADATTNYAVYSILSDIPRLSTLIGRVILPSSTHSPSSCEFIVLS
ncbi:hypothetical protein AZE42_09177, partial [Rhizopogon vesiculosus]